MTCKCGCNRFYAHQVVRIDIICNEYGEFDDNIYKDDIEASIYDAERPYGPFQCVECGAEYDELN